MCSGNVGLLAYVNFELWDVICCSGFGGMQASSTEGGGRGLDARPRDSCEYIRIGISNGVGAREFWNRTH